MAEATHKVKIVTKHEAEFTQLLSEMRLPGLEITQSISEATILLASPSTLSKELHLYPNVQWVQSVAAGVNQLMDDTLPKHYQLTNIKDIFGPQIAEYVLGYCIARFRHFNEYQEQQAQKVWKPLEYQTLLDKKMVILGTGSIGNHLAKAASVFGFTTMGVNTKGIPPKNSEFDCVYHVDELARILANADVVVSTLPSTNATHQLLNADFFEACEQVLLFNVGRGEVIDTSALLSALSEGKVAHAYLDVFINEPISQECPYWHHPDVTVTPHVAAYSFPKQVLETFEKNYLKWINDEPLVNVIDFQKGY